jgi:tight adherence protein C
MDVSIQVLVGALSVVMAVPLLVWGLSISSDREGDRVLQNLGPVGTRPTTPGGHPAGLTTRAVIPAIRSVAERARRLTPASWVRALDRRLRLAGSPRPWTLERVLAVKLALGLSGLVAGLYLLAAGTTTVNVLGAILTLVAGYAAPDLVLWGRAQERQRVIQLALPDTLDQMTISMEAGIGFDAAIKRTADAGNGPLTDELHQVLGELKLGIGRRMAFQHLVERTEVAELRHFVFAVNQADEYGLPIAHVLRIQAEEARVKRRQRAEEQALKIPVKIVFPLVVCILPSLFIVLLGPAVIRIATMLF